MYYTTIGRKIVLTEEGIALFKQRLLVEKTSQANLSEETGICSETIRRLKKELFPDQIIDNRIKYQFDHTAFNRIDTEEKAYWLGFFAADGNIYEKRNSIQIRLKSTDANHLEKFCRFLKLDESKVAIYPCGKDNLFLGAHLHIDSKQLKADLIDKGVTPKKKV